MSRLFAGIARLFDKRLRGFRVVDLGALAFLVMLVLGVYAFKAAAGREGGRIKDVDQSIAEETRAVRLLRAEVAHLEAPDRLQKLSAAYLGLKPENARHEAAAESLPDLIRPAASTPSPTAAAAAPPIAPAAGLSTASAEATR